MRLVLIACAMMLGACRGKAPEAPRARPAVATASAPASPPPAPDQAAGETAEQRERRVEREDFAAAIDIAVAAGQTCRTDPGAIDVDALLDAYAILAPYERSPARDGAITTLELCRRLAIEHVDATLPEDPKNPDSSIAVRRAVDAQSRRTTKPLRFVVRGKHVTVEEKRTPDRKPRAPKVLQGHCAMSDAPPVEQVDVVTATDGEVTCSSAFRFSKQSDYVVQRVGLSDPFVLDSTAQRKTPTEPPPR